MKNIYTNIKLSIYGRQFVIGGSTRGLLVALIFHVMIMTSIRVLEIYNQANQNYINTGHIYKIKSADKRI